jgi:two-component system response regulator FixJ
MSMSSEVCIIDDDEAVRLSLSFLLNMAGIATRTYDSAMQFLREAANQFTGCIVTDVRMPELDGLELVRRMRERGLSNPIIVVTGHGDIALAVEAMKAGAFDFIEKPFDDGALLNSVKAALHLDHQASQAESAKQRYRAAFSALSPREREVLQSVVAGKTNKIIAYEFGISARTVEVHRANLMMKVGAGSLSELVRMALVADL